MTRKTRRFLFTVGIVLFILIVPIIIGYSFGYRYDIERNEITQVGALSLKTTPENAAVFLDNKKTHKETPTVLRGLFPNRSYNVRLEHKGFYLWEKELTVMPERITAADSLFLFPKDISGTTTLSITEPIASFSLSPDGAQALVVTENNRLLNINTQTGAQQLLAFSDGLSTQQISAMQWSPQGSFALFLRRTPGQAFWYTFSRETGELANLTRLYHNTLVISSPSALPLPTKFSPIDISFTNNEGEVAAVSEGVLLRINLSSLTLETLATTSAPVVFKEETLLSVRDDMLVQEIISSETEEDIIATLPFTPEHFLLSPNGEKLAFWHDFALGVVWLANTTQQPFYKEGDTTVLLQPLNSIKKVRWHSSNNYLLANTHNAVLTAVELDGRGEKHNTWQWENVVDFDYLTNTQKLWILTPEGTIQTYSDRF